MIVNPQCWDDRIANAEERGVFTQDDCDMANNWSSCSVGEARRLYHIDVGIPIDTKAGLDFNDAVESDNVPRARQLHEEIKLAARKLVKA